MKCVNHPDRDAIAQCRMCKDLLCESCAIVFKDGHTLCASCFDRLRSPRTNTVSSPIEKAPLKDSDRYINKLPIRPEPRPRQASPTHMKFCKYCGKQIPEDAVICTLCGRQVEPLQTAQHGSPDTAFDDVSIAYAENAIVTESGIHTMVLKSKITSLLLCIFLGSFGAHKFYEGHIGAGILYLLTLGLLGIGVLADFIYLLGVPNMYYVHR